MALSFHSIEELAAMDQAGDNVWSDMTEFAFDNGVVSSKHLGELLEPMENEFREKYFSDNPKAKFKDGRWKNTYTIKDENGKSKKRYIIPNAWGVSKSILGKAIDKGVPYFKRGQDAVKTDPQYVGEGGSDKTPSEKAVIMADTLFKFVKKHQDEFEQDSAEIVASFCDSIINYTRK